MLKSKVFLKKTKRGGVLKIVREHYLRDDISCGHIDCQKCSEMTSCVMETDDDSGDVVRPGDNLKQASTTNLASDLTTVIEGHAEKHIIIPDTNVVIHQVTYVTCNLT